MSDDHSKAIVAQRVEVEPADDRVIHPLAKAAMKAIGDNPTPETLREILQLQRDWQAMEAKKAFDAALVQMKRELPSVINRDQTVSFSSTRYTHASLANVVDSVTDIAGKHGFAITWDSDTSGRDIAVTCRLSHSAGHEHLTTMSSPVDTSGSKGPCQARMSTVTMLQRYTLVLALGLATGDMKEPHGPRPEPDADAPSDPLRVAEALQRLQRMGITKDEAEHAMDGKPSTAWTGRDLHDLWAWARDRRAAEGGG